MAEGDRYVTVTPAVGFRKFNVSVRVETKDEEYTITRMSEALSAIAARMLAKNWAAAMKVEIR